MHMLSWGLYLPRRTERGRDAARRLGLPPEVVEERIGFRSKHVPGDDDGCAAMASRAARTALRRARVRPDDVDLVIYCGSEHKEHIVWSAASHIQRTLGARRALSFEVYALCAGLPIAIEVARDMMAASRRYRKVLVATASREGDLIDYANPRTRWMANFGAGGGAVLLGRRGGRAVLLGFDGLTDSRLSMGVVQPAGGSSMPASRETVDRDLHNLDVPDIEGLREVLEEVSLPNFRRTILGALRPSGHGLRDVSLVCITLVKPSFHETLVEFLGLDPARVIALDRVGHMQSVDQISALEIARRRRRLEPGGIVVLAAAGTGYTWSAMALRWRR